MSDFDLGYVSEPFRTLAGADFRIEWARSSIGDASRLCTASHHRAGPRGTPKRTRVGSNISPIYPPISTIIHPLGVACSLMILCKQGANVLGRLGNGFY